ncbi:MAG TPA: transketolase [Candidatus Paceibacterota bacterium]
MLHLHESKIKELEEKANQARQLLIEMLVEAGSGHTAGPLGMADVFTAFYFHILNHDPANPEWEDRDRLILSNGHITPIRYALMAMSGYFPTEELKTLRKFGTRLQGHPERERLPGVETTSGPLGSGLGQACGIAYGARMSAKGGSASDGDTLKFRTYCFMSDGEHDSGVLWESVLFAGKNKLSNLTGLIDRNNIQIDGMTENIMPLEPLKEKYEAFGWHVLDIDGHNFEEIADAVEQAKAIYEKPTVIISHNIPGKGIKEIEFDYRWHGSPPGAGPEDVFKKDEQSKKFLEELRTLGGKLESEHQ